VRDDPPVVFERFDERARMVVVLAQEEAREMRHADIAGEHLLLGIARVDPRLAGTHPDRIRGAVVERRGIGDAAPTGEMPFTAEARGALESAGRAAVRDDDPAVAPAHILRALLELRGAAAEVLAELGADPTPTVDAAIVGGRAPGTRLPPELVQAEAQVLLMLLRGGGPGAQLLLRHGIDEDAVRAELGYSADS
jgi:ClpA/ClpB-like protein